MLDFSRGCMPYKSTVYKIEISVIFLLFKNSLRQEKYNAYKTYVSYHLVCLYLYSKTIEKCLSKKIVTLDEEKNKFFCQNLGV